MQFTRVYLGRNRADDENFGGPLQLPKTASMKIFFRSALYFSTYNTTVCASVIFSESLFRVIEREKCVFEKKYAAGLIIYIYIFYVYVCIKYHISGALDNEETPPVAAALS